LIDEYDKETKTLKKAIHPEPSAEQQAADGKQELRRLHVIAEEAAARPEVLLPAAYRNLGGIGSVALGPEMKDAIERSTAELKEWRSKLQALQAEAANWDSRQSARRAERDRLFQQVATAKAQSVERAPVAEGSIPSARKLPQERLINVQWKARLDALRLQVIEAQLALAVKLIGVRDVNVQICQARIATAEKTLALLQERWRTAAELKERELKAKATQAESAARRSEDPLERLRARRLADLLALEAQVVKHEQFLATSPPPSLDEQRSLADHAQGDFARIKELLDDGHVSRLDAIRLNNEFRRIGPERDRLVRNEMAVVEARMQYYEDALTSVEIELLRDSSHDRVEHDLLRERLPPARWAEGEGMLAELDQKHRSLLVRRRAALERLTNDTAQTLDEVTRRLGILDQEYGFIRTHLFWVRDEEPIGPGTVSQGIRECQGLTKALVRMGEETGDGRHWGRPSAEFVVAALVVPILTIGLVRLRRRLSALSDPDSHHSRPLRSLWLGMAGAVAWPLYLVLLAYTARQAPWPRCVAIPFSAVLTAVALVMFFQALVGWLLRPAGWVEQHLDVPADVTRQLSRAGRFGAVVAGAFLLPVFLLDHGLIAPDGRPVSTQALSRFLILGFELAVWGMLVRLLRARSALLGWLSIGPADNPGGSATARVHAGLAWLSRKRRITGWLALLAIAMIIILDARGYSYSAHRLAVAGSQTAIVVVVGAAIYRLIARMVDRHAESWAQAHQFWAVALTSAVARRSSVGRAGGWSGSSHDLAPASADSADPPALIRADDLAAGLRSICACMVAGLGLVAVVWLWDLDLALLRFLLNQPLWFFDDQSPVTVGDLGEAVAIVVAGAVAWRYMGTFFALTFFRRMPDDPGVRFAIVTLCRYAVLALTAIAALGAIRLDMAKIGVVLAALGVGLGFGLQEIVSNFVCGIILLLERPIRIGDVVTVGGTTGRVDRIHIRATTIVNADNQSMIVPNREFITGNLVNWTHKDKILRIAIKLAVAYGTDPERVVQLLLDVTRADSDVLANPEPSAALEGFGESSLLFAVYAYVPDPSLVGPVRHRLCSEIQRRFAQEGVVIPLPARQLHFGPIPHDLARALEVVEPDHSEPRRGRLDPPAPMPPGRHAGIGSAAGLSARPGDDGVHAERRV
jgi:potassium efflux system protein